MLTRWTPNLDLPFTFLLILFLTTFVKVLTADVSHLQLYSGPSLSGPSTPGPAFQRPGGNMFQAQLIQLSAHRWYTRVFLAVWDDTVLYSALLHSDIFYECRV